MTIFLDLDGVMITEWSDTQPKERLFEGFAKPFQPEAVAIINELIKTEKAKIVLSSDWRFMFRRDKLDEFFRFNNINKSPFPMPYDFRSHFLEKERMEKLERARSKEIETYVKEYELKKFIIFDDLKLTCFPEHFVNTEFRTGLTYDYRDAIAQICRLDG